MKRTQKQSYSTFKIDGFFSTFICVLSALYPCEKQTHVGEEHVAKLQCDVFKGNVFNEVIKMID